METEYNYYFFIGIVGQNSSMDTVYTKVLMAYKEYPTMDEIEKSIKKENKLLINVIVISFSELTPEQYNKLYPENPLTDERPEETRDENDTSE